VIQLALVGMLIVPTKIFVSLATGAILVVLVAVIAALTLLPALISLLGDRIERLRVPFFGRRAQRSSETGGFWGRIVTVVMRHPVVALVLSVAVLSDSALDAVRALRNTYLPDALTGTELNAYVTGASAQNLDYFAITDKYRPIVFVLMLGLSFVLLMVAFRSVVVPASSIVMNLLSLGAAYGLLVFVTQQGHGADLFGLQQVPIVEAWIPLFLFSVLFGLSMDYQVFLLSRIRKRYDHAAMPGRPWHTASAPRRG
jgi:RND superfamily putative drug exporter